jgi:hypothetical protein
MSTACGAPKNVFGMTVDALKTPDMHLFRADHTCIARATSVNMWLICNPPSFPGGLGAQWWPAQVSVATASASTQQ